MQDEQWLSGQVQGFDISVVLVCYSSSVRLMSKRRGLEALSNTHTIVSTMKQAGHLSQDVDGWALKLQALEVMNRLASCFGKLVAPHMPPVLEHAWCMVSSCLCLYQAAVVDAEEALEEQTVRTIWAIACAGMSGLTSVSCARLHWASAW